MIEKIVRGLIIGIIVAVATLIGFGWKAYGEINAMNKATKKEVKEELMEIRDRDMGYMRDRFDTIEKLMVGKVITKTPLPTSEP